MFVSHLQSQVFWQYAQKGQLADHEEQLAKFDKTCIGITITHSNFKGWRSCECGWCDVFMRVRVNKVYLFSIGFVCTCTCPPLYLLWQHTPTTVLRMMRTKPPPAAGITTKYRYHNFSENINTRIWWAQMTCYSYSRNVSKSAYTWTVTLGIHSHSDIDYSSNIRLT